MPAEERIHALIAEPCICEPAVVRVVQMQKLAEEVRELWDPAESPGQFCADTDVVDADTINDQPLYGTDRAGAVRLSVRSDSIRKPPIKSSLLNVPTHIATSRANAEDWFPVGNHSSRDPVADPRYPVPPSTESVITSEGGEQSLPARERSMDRLRLTRRGRLLADAVVRALLP